MKVQTTPHKISFSLTQDIHLDERELAFLRQMAQFCVENNMSGNYACEKLDNLLNQMGIKVYDENGIRGLFEAS